MVALVYAKYLSENPRSTVVRKSQFIAHSVKDPADFTIVGISVGYEAGSGDIMKRIAIVTGASRGIGRAVAKRLAQDGFAVVVNYLSNAAEAEDVVTELKRIGGNAVAIRSDVSSPPDVERLFNETNTKFGNVDVVVHNSGIMPLSPVGKNDFELFDKVISANLRGAFLVLAQAAPHIASGGRIVAFSSSVLANNFPTYGQCITSKA